MPHEAVILIEVCRIPGDNGRIPYSTGGEKHELVSWKTAVRRSVRACRGFHAGSLARRGLVWRDPYWAVGVHRFLQRNWRFRNCLRRERHRLEGFRWISI